MNIYQYIAHNSPDECFQFCNKYGYYEIANIDELGEVSEVIVSQHGEKAFKEILQYHPDREVILEVYQKMPQARTLQFEGESVPFEKNPLHAKYFNAEGDSGGKLVNQTNLFILVGAIVISFAILSNK